MGYRSDVTIQIEAKSLDTLKRIASEYSRLKINGSEDVIEAFEYKTKWSETPIYTFIVVFINVNFYEEHSDVKEFLTWFNLYSEIAEVGENTYGIYSTQFIRIGDDYGDEEIKIHGDVWNGIYLKRSIEVDVEEKGIPIESINLE